MFDIVDMNKIIDENKSEQLEHHLVALESNYFTLIESIRKYREFYKAYYKFTTFNYPYMKSE